MNPALRPVMFAGAIGVAMGLTTVGVAVVAVELSRIAWRHFTGHPTPVEPLLRAD